MRVRCVLRRRSRGRWAGVLPCVRVWLRAVLVVSGRQTLFLAFLAVGALRSLRLVGQSNRHTPSTTHPALAAYLLRIMICGEVCSEGTAGRVGERETARLVPRVGSECTVVFFVCES